MKPNGNIPIWVLGLTVTILIAVVSNLTSEIRSQRAALTSEIQSLRAEVLESRKFAVQYTDKMVELIIKTGDKKK